MKEDRPGEFLPNVNIITKIAYTMPQTHFDLLVPLPEDQILANLMSHEDGKNASYESFIEEKLKEEEMLIAHLKGMLEKSD